MEISFIGCGKMAQAIASSVHRDAPKIKIFGFDINDDALNTFSKYGQPISLENALTKKIIILAIKPQQLTEFLATFHSEFKEDSIIISIAAGKSISFYESFLQSQAIVRVMPNINAQVAQSTSAVAFNKKCSDEQKELCLHIFNRIGSTYVISENQFSAFTAISGSAPAYFFKVINEMMKFAITNGFEEKISKEIIASTMIASAQFALESEDELEVLIKNVTSPNGTTEAALNSFSQHNLDYTIQAALEACYARDKQLNEKID